MYDIFGDLLLLPQARWAPMNVEQQADVELLAFLERQLEVMAERFDIDADFLYTCH